MNELRLSDGQITSGFYTKRLVDGWNWVCKACPTWVYTLDEAVSGITKAERMALSNHTATERHQHNQTLAKLANE